MGTTTGVLTGLSYPAVYRQMGDTCGILVGPKHKPKMLLAGNRGYNLGLHDRTWYEQLARASGTGTYYVRVVPMFSEITDPDGVPLLGTPTAENTTKGTTFSFDPFPDGYACDGYKVYAGTNSGELYYQGELEGRFNTVFTIGSSPLSNPYATVDQLSAQSMGPPCFAHALEVFESEGAIDSRIFLGGGKSYATGYAKVATATSAPSLACGTAGTTTVATWQAVTAASFRMMLGWSESSIDYEQEFDFDGITFAADNSMALFAARIQTAIRAARHPALYCGTGATTTIATWTAITAGSFDIWVDGVIKHVISVDFTGDTTMANVATSIETAMQALGGTMAAATCTWDGTRFIVKANNSTAAATTLLSYLTPNSSGTGTDLSSMMKGRETDTAVHLMRRGKGATTAESVAWDATHFDISSSSTGQQYRLGYLTSAATGTAIGGASFMNGAVTAIGSLYTPGLTAKRSVQGDGTFWGDWMEGMLFRVESEFNQFEITRIYDEDLFALDSDYVGDGFFAWNEYICIPSNAQVYVSELRNPFKFTESNVFPTPVADGDGITAIRRNGSSVSVFMDHHIWDMAAVSLNAPKMISNTFGAPNTASCVEYAGGIAVFTGKDFIFLRGESHTKLDPERRMKQYVDRLSANFTDYHGVYDNSENKEMIKWFVGLDSSYVAGYVFVLEPSTGNWWLHNAKNASASCMVRNAANQTYLVTGDTYDTGHAIKAWLHRWSQDYHNDSAVDSSAYDRDGIVNSLGAATTTAGYLTCGTEGTNVVNTWKGVTAGYFSVTIDDVSYDVGPVDLSTATTTMASVATLLTTALRAKTGGTETITYSTNHFVVTSGTTTARSNVGYLRPYRPVATMTDLTSKSWMNGREDHATLTYAVNQRVLNLYNWSSVAATCYAASDGEMGAWLFVCDSNFRNGQYSRIVSNTAATVTVSPDFTTVPAAGWYWYIGGIVPTWTKWNDWGSPQHKNKVHGIAITVRQTETATGNTLAVHEMQDLSTTIRVTKTMPLGTGNDTVQTVYPADKTCTQFGIKIMRPSSVHDLQVDDITVAHRARV